jgi:hypothetical protein
MGTGEPAGEGDALAVGAGDEMADTPGEGEIADC